MLKNIKNMYIIKTIKLILYLIIVNQSEDKMNYL